MPAANTDKFRKSYSFTQKTLNGTITDSDTTLTLNNATNLPTDTAISFVVDRVDSNGNLTPNTRELMTGVVSGSTITGLLRGEHSTTAQAHANGAIVEFVNSGKAHNDLIDGILADHSQSGGHEIATNYDPNNPTLETQKWAGVASAVNELTVTNSATGNPVKLAPTGGDTNVNLNLLGKGTGKPVVGVPALAIYPFNYVSSGCVWSGDAYGSTRAASMTSGVIVIGGNPLNAATVTARAFTASKDTYIDASDNGDGTALLTYTEAVNNAASPALAAGSIRIGIIITGAGNIADVGSVNQGEVNKVLPINTSLPYAVTDSLGNMICNRNPSPTVIGYRQTTSTQSSSSTSAVAMVPLSCPVIIPANRRVKVTVWGTSVGNSVLNSYCQIGIWLGTVGSGTRLALSTGQSAVAAGEMPVLVEGYTNQTSGQTGSLTFNGAINAAVSGTASLNVSATSPGFIKVELV